MMIDVMTRYIRLLLLSSLLFLVTVMAYAQDPVPGAPQPGAAPREQSSSAFVIARLKYSGGGDWYNDQSSEVNMLDYLRQHTTMNVRPTFEYVDLSSDNIFNYPLLFMTGHGNVSLTDAEAKRLRAYLDNGGFLYIDDDYGLDTAIRREMHKVFPDQQFQELPFSHPIYHSFFDFPHGLPKIHEHNAKPPQGFGLFTEQKRLCVFYTYETNPSDGWADANVHNDPADKREEAFKIGTNIIVYALTN
jgi:hypothetical protein